MTLEWTDCLNGISVSPYDGGKHSPDFPLGNSLTFVDTYFGKKD